MQSSPIYVHSSPSIPSSPIYVHSSPVRAVYKPDAFKPTQTTVLARHPETVLPESCPRTLPSISGCLCTDKCRRMPSSPENDGLPQFTLPPGPYCMDLPNHSLPDIVGQAIMSSRSRCLKLSDIWNWISTVYPYFHLAKKRWRPLIHSVLQRNEIFLCLGKDSLEDPKHWRWTIREKDRPLFTDGGFRSARRSLRSRRWRQSGLNALARKTSTRFGPIKSRVTTTKRLMLVLPITTVASLFQKLLAIHTPHLHRHHL
ncbi:winged helix DNA-binding domain-containing protein [Hymenopellis radicata]|nr:winged helix DNA-binding domain-containing protein [Hymenopellis radicata]